jgi:hypothetical protein
VVLVTGIFSPYQKVAFASTSKDDEGDIGGGGDNRNEGQESSPESDGDESSNNNEGNIDSGNDNNNGDDTILIRKMPMVMGKATYVTL